MIISDTNLNPPSANSLINAGYKTYQPVKPWGFKTTTYWKKNLHGRAYHVGATS